MDATSTYIHQYYRTTLATAVDDVQQKEFHHLQRALKVGCRC